MSSKKRAFSTLAADVSSSSSSSAMDIVPASKEEALMKERMKKNWPKFKTVIGKKFVTDEKGKRVKDENGNPIEIEVEQEVMIEPGYEPLVQAPYSLTEERLKHVFFEPIPTNEAEGRLIELKAGRIRELEQKSRKIEELDEELRITEELKKQSGKTKELEQRLHKIEELQKEVGKIDSTKLTKADKYIRMLRQEALYGLTPALFKLNMPWLATMEEQEAIPISELELLFKEYERRVEKRKYFEIAAEGLIRQANENEEALKIDLKNLKTNPESDSFKNSAEKHRKAAGDARDEAALKREEAKQLATSNEYERRIERRKKLEMDADSLMKAAKEYDIVADKEVDKQKKFPLNADTYKKVEDENRNKAADARNLAELQREEAKQLATFDEDNVKLMRQTLTRVKQEQEIQGVIPRSSALNASSSSYPSSSSSYSSAVFGKSGSLSTAPMDITPSFSSTSSVSASSSNSLPLSKGDQDKVEMSMCPSGGKRFPPAPRGKIYNYKTGKLVRIGGKAFWAMVEHDAYLINPPTGCRTKRNSKLYRSIVEQARKH